MEPNKNSNEETKNKNLDDQKKQSSIKSMESVLRPGKGSMVGKICERCRYSQTVLKDAAPLSCRGHSFNGLFSRRTWVNQHQKG